MNTHNMLSWRNKKNNFLDTKLSWSCGPTVETGSVFCNFYVAFCMHR